MQSYRRWRNKIPKFMASNISKVSIREEPNGWIRVKRFQELFKIVLLGDSGVGKTSLGYQYAEEKILQKPQLTVGFDYWTKQIEIEGETVKLEIWDTAGTEEYRKSMIPQYYRNVDGVLIVYDLANEKSFQNLEVWMKELKHHRGMENLIVVLVGNKADKVVTGEEKITEGMISRFTMTYHIKDAFQTSSQKIEYLQQTRDIFKTIAERIFAHKIEMTTSLSRSVITLHDDWVMVQPSDVPRRRSFTTCCIIL